MTTPTALLEGDARAAWLEERRTGVGSSDASALVGLNRYSSALEVYLQKIGELGSEPENEAMRWGNILEGPVAEEFANQTGFDIVVPPIPEGAVSGMVRSDLWPWMTANIDRYLAEPGADEWCALLEVKTGGPYVAADWGDEPPDHVLVQVQHQLAVTGLSRAFVAVLIAGQHFRYYEVLRGDEIIAGLVELEREFWDQVTRRDPPAPDASDSAADALLAMYDFERESEVDLPPEASTLIAAYARTGVEEKELKTKRKGLANAIKALLGDHHVGLLAGEKAVSWPRWSEKRLDRDAMEADHPKLVAQYLVDERRGRLVLPKKAA